MSETEGISTGELGRAVALIRGDITSLASKLDGVPTKAEVDRQLVAAKELADLKNELQDKAIAALEEWNTWALRLGAPALVAAIGGVLFNAARLGG